MNTAAAERHPESVVEYTINAIRETIRSGGFAPGQRLVVADLTKRFSVSAGPVREAIRRLTGEGLIDITPHRGATVKEFGRQDVREIFELREVVEGLAARLAAEKVGDGDNRSRMKSTLEEMRQIVAVREEGYVQHNQSFHELIYAMANNRRVTEAAKELTLPLYRLRYHYSMSRAYIKTSAGEHELIGAAILDGDAARAERAMRKHIRNSGEAMLDSLPEGD
jgi:DNA-binding GntR family transcriptional regulator